MANTLSKTGIVDNNTIRTWHVTQSIDAFNGTSAYDITLSGSLNIIGPLNLDSPVTGNLITNASYALSSSYSHIALSSSTTDYANVSYDTLVIQLHHGQVNTISNSTSYYFDCNPFTDQITTLPTNSNQAGTYTPSTLRILSSSVSTTCNGTLGTNTTSSYKLHYNDSTYNFTQTLTHDNVFDSFVEGVNITLEPFTNIHMEWITGTGYGLANNIAHNVVLYCTRTFDPIT
jgi:hypothetical protein